MSTPPVVVLRNVSKTFGTGHAAVHAVTNVSLRVERGEIVLIMGPSGSGKTTLLTLIGALLTADSGSVSVAGSHFKRRRISRLATFRRRTIGFVFQSFNLLAALNAVQNVEVVLRLDRQSKKVARAKAEALLRSLGLAQRLHSLPKQLSGGEKQRVSLARALVNNPPLLIADEPTANLDSQNGRLIMTLLRNVAKKEQRTVIIASHDQRIMNIADRVLWLEDGKIRPHVIGLVVDPVCGMKLQREQAPFTAQHQGRTYYFCSKPDQTTFLQHPEKYVT